MEIKRDIYLGEHHWRVIYHGEEIAFYYVKTELPELSALDIGFLHGDERDDFLFEPVETLEWINPKKIKDINPFVIKKAIIREVISIAEHIDFFYFQASCKELNRIYQVISFTLWEHLGEKWDFQNANGWYYFSRQ
jgi:hypothetical protein